MNLYHIKWVIILFILVSTSSQTEITSSKELISKSDFLKSIDKSSVDSLDPGILVNTIDGDVHLIDKDTGNIKWSFSSGSALISSSSSKSSSSMSTDFSFIPSIDGTILFMNEDGVERTSFQAKDIVEQSPFVAGNGLIFSGNQITNLYGIDHKTGKPIYKITSKESSNQCIPNNDHEDNKNDINSQKLLILGRTDYTIRGYDVDTGIEKFNLTYGEIKVVSGNYMMPKLNSLDAFVTDEKGSLSFYPNNERRKWTKQLNSPISMIPSLPNNLKRRFDKKTFNKLNELTAYLGKLRNGQEYIIPFDSRENLLALPSPNDDMKTEFNQQGTLSEEKLFYPECNGLNNVSCVLKYRKNFFLNTETCPDQNYIVHAPPDLNPVFTYSTMLTSFIVILVGCFILIIIICGILNILKSKKYQYLSSGYNSNIIQNGQRDEMGYLIIGSLRISSEILGYGSHGTIVYSGILGHRHVAIKRMLSQFHAHADREISLLINSDGHANVVRYFAKEEYNDFVYLALEKCCYTLGYAIQTLQAKPLKTTTNYHFSKSIFKEKRRVCVFLHALTSGVAHLHQLKIVHRDLKPHNILLSEVDSGLYLGIPKISDMGLGKQLHEDQSSYASSSHISLKPSVNMKEVSCSNPSSFTAPGTVGWQAPEVLISRFGSNQEGIKLSSSLSNTSNVIEEELLMNAKKTEAVDVFSLGCIFMYVLEPGSHPFGVWYERERNILIGSSFLSSLEHYPEAYDLISSMIKINPLLRPTTEQVLNHPFFWNSSKILNFLMDVSDRLERLPRGDNLLNHFEKNASFITHHSWDSVIDRSLITQLESYRKYNVNSVRDLLRLIRNHRHHYHQLSKDIQIVLGSVPDEFWFYFSSRFPFLLMHCYQFIGNFCIYEKTFHIHLGSMTTYFKKLDQEKKKIDPLQSIDISKQNDVVRWSIRMDGIRPYGWYPSAWKWITKKTVTNNKVNIEDKKDMMDDKFRTAHCVSWKESLGTSCKYGNKCVFAHGFHAQRIPFAKLNWNWMDEDDQVYDVLNIQGNVDVDRNKEKDNQYYKTKVCKYFSNSIGCSNGSNCMFLHPGVD